MVFIYRCFIAGLCDFTITFYLYIFLSMDFLSEINYMYVCIMIIGADRVVSGLMSCMYRLAICLTYHICNHIALFIVLYCFY